MDWSEDGCAGSGVVYRISFKSDGIDSSESASMTGFQARDPTRNQDGS